MTRRRRAFVLAGLALLLGAFAASDVAGREAALRRELGPVVPVVVARVDLPAGRALRAHDLAVRQVPARFAPRAALADPGQAAGLRPASPVPRGTDLTAEQLAERRPDEGAPVRAGERVADLVAAGSPEIVRAGGHVDVLVTRSGRDGRAGSTMLALEDVEVLSAAPASPAGDDPARRVAVSLRVTLRQAVYLAAAQAFARELRVLPRSAGDRRRGAQGLRVDSGL